ncbi:MAG: hypothetical protein IIA61_02975 [Candidatus Marinimicrobia bacterium]|nr:hypothetical protein [Candidatus Neomarinimicrobiota bacterium]
MRRVNNKVFYNLVFFLYMCITVVILIEVSFRLFVDLFPQPTKSIIKEAKRISYSNLRVYGQGLAGGVAILLPNDDKVDFMVLGDSFPGGTYVKKENRFPEVIAKLSNTVVANLSVGSKGPPIYNRMLEVGVRYKPSIVLYCFFANDFIYEGELGANEYKEVLKRNLSINNTYKNLPNDREYFLDELKTTDKLNNFRRKITNHFVSFQIFKLLKQPSQNVTHVPYVFKDNYFAFSVKEYWDSIISWKNENVKSSLAINVKLIDQAKNFALQNGMQMIVILIPSKEMVYGNIIQDEVVRKKIWTSYHHKTYKKFNVKLDELGIPWIDITEPLISYAKQGYKLYFSIDGHFNELGHQFSAEIIYKYLKENNYFKPEFNS